MNGEHDFGNDQQQQEQDEIDEVKGELQPAAPLFRSMILHADGPTVAFTPQNENKPFSSQKTRSSDKEKNLGFTKQSSSVESEIAENEVKIGWTNPELKRIGLFDSPSKDNVEVDADRLDHVLQGLTVFFRLNSVQVIYENSPISASCRVMENSEFQILVWLSRKNQRKLLVEVSRTSGDSVLFRSKYAKMVLDAVRNAASALTPVQSHVDESVTTRDPILRGTLEEDRDEFEAMNYLMTDRSNFVQMPSYLFPEDPVDSALEIVDDLLAAERYDAVKMALESLSHLTDPFKSGVTTAKQVSSTVLMGFAESSNKLKTWKRVQSSVLSLAFQNDRDPNEPGDYEFTALTIVAQAVNQVDSTVLSGFLLNARNVLPGPLSNVVDSLIQKVNNATKAPHAAYLATHILAVLCRHQIPEAHKKMQLHRDYIYQAQLVGAVSHAALEQATERLLHALTDYPIDNSTTALA